jgi:hypothetical protein
MEIAAILFLLGCTATAVYTLYGVVWRLYLSPVAKFPGPRLAALTFWYEFYYDVIKEGAYVYEIERMHQKYGAYTCYTRSSINQSTGTVTRSMALLGSRPLS